MPPSSLTITNNSSQKEREMDDFEAATGRFLAWFKSVGGEFRDDLLEIRDLRSRDAGRGISEWLLSSIGKL